MSKATQTKTKTPTTIQAKCISISGENITFEGGASLTTDSVDLARRFADELGGNARLSIYKDRVSVAKVCNMGVDFTPGQLEAMAGLINAVAEG
jgi:hypothetical protein